MDGRARPRVLLAMFVQGFTWFMGRFESILFPLFITLLSNPPRPASQGTTVTKPRPEMPRRPHLRESTARILSPGYEVPTAVCCGPSPSLLQREHALHRRRAENVASLALPGRRRPHHVGTRRSGLDTAEKAHS
jgi:hypothetical protein